VIIGVDMEEINKFNRNGLLLYLQMMGGNNVCINSHAKTWRHRYYITPVGRQLYECIKLLSNMLTLHVIN
jgi:predicted transcriptional regulator